MVNRQVEKEKMKYWTKNLAEIALHRNFLHLSWIEPGTSISCGNEPKRFKSGAKSKIVIHVKKPRYTNLYGFFFAYKFQLIGLHQLDSFILLQPIGKYPIVSKHSWYYTRVFYLIQKIII